MQLMKPVIAVILATSVAGCLIETEQLANPVTTPASPAKYDASWHKSDYWPGEYPDGFATARNVTVKIRETPDPDAPKSVSCALRKGATYHPWNEARVASDQLEFVSFSKIYTFEANENFTVGLERASDNADVTIEFHKGDRWLYLADDQEDIYHLKVGDTIYHAIGFYLLKKSARVDAPVKSERSNVDEWVKLKCANGAVGWIFYNEIIKTPGFSTYHSENYGHAYDKEPRPKSRSGER